MFDRIEILEYIKKHRIIILEEIVNARELRKALEDIRIIASTWDRMINKPAELFKMIEIRAKSSISAVEKNRDNS